METFLGDPEYGAEIQIHPNGKWLFVSNRGTGPILLYYIDPESKLLSLKQVSIMNFKQYVSKFITKK